MIEFGGGGGGGGGSTPWDFKPPLASAFTLFSTDSTELTLTDDSDAGLLIDGGALTGSAVFRTGYIPLTIPADDWVLVVKRKALLTLHSAHSGLGIFCEDGTTGKYIEFGVRNDQGLWAGSYNSIPSSFNAILFNSSSTGPLNGSTFEWFRMRHLSGTLHFDASAEGKQWTSLATIADSAFMTNGANRVGLVAVMTDSGVPDIVGSVPYWSLTGAGV